jgi:hypothetical protein
VPTEMHTPTQERHSTSVTQELLAQRTQSPVWLEIAHSSTQAPSRTRCIMTARPH